MTSNRKAWRVYLGNQHAMCRCVGEGRSRKDAFRVAFHKARKEFRHHKLSVLFGSGLQADKQWVRAFNEALGNMVRGSTTSSTYENPRGFNVEIRRL